MVHICISQGSPGKWNRGYVCVWVGGEWVEREKGGRERETHFQDLRLASLEPGGQANRPNSGKSFQTWGRTSLKNFSFVDWRSLRSCRRSWQSLGSSPKPASTGSFQL